ncbi:T9SS type A sorting domain-containing protein [Ochrovirga pacifica]|uniref:T9SS type A sorting domain-containing protein n=1 Tax=Ochrovirga pacifica TaxID=1042376 RepID=UPI0002559513|nr:T9SS type A sorting domain-containing protein [Ochrovirga pacifica]
MKKIILCLLSVFSLTANAQLAFQGFESSASDTWNYSSNIPAYNLNSDTDLWTTFSTPIGSLGGPFEGSNYWVGRDLDNPYSESQTGDTTPDHYLTFDTVNIQGNAVTLSFMCEFEGYDSSDFFFYELSYNNGSDWTSPDVHVDIVPNPSGSNLSSVGNTWQEFTYNIPSGHNYVRLRFGAYQNGASDYLALDNVSLNGASLSSNKNELKFTYSPNPVKTHLNINSQEFIKKIIVYNSIGKELIRRQENSLNSIVNLENLPAGIYYMKVISINNFKTVKFIKE